MKSITPDSITGMIFTLEGMNNTVVLLNGPMGCRFYHSTTSQFLRIRPLLCLPEGEGGQRYPVDYNTLNEWFFRQERVPCTYLDSYDYVYGTRDKVGAAIDYISANIDFDIIAIINSPGAALIGDDLLDMVREKLGGSRVVMLESSGYSSTYEEGCSQASALMLEQVARPLWDAQGICPDNRIKSKIQLAEKADHKPKSVNILGLNIWQRYYSGDIKELSRLFGLCGMEVNAVLCADCSIEDLKRLPEADLNVVLYPEIGLQSAKYMKEVLGMPYYICEGPPVGFKATEQIFTDICGILSCSDQALLEDSGRARAAAYAVLKDLSRSYGKPRGVRFFVECTPSLKRSYERFLEEYLGMERSGPEEAELIFSNANVISELMLENKRFCGIEISLPGMGYTDLVPKTHMGTQGALFLIEQVINGLMSKI